MAAATRQLLSVTSELYDRGDLVFAESKRLTKLDAKVASAASSLSDALRHAQPSESTLSSRLSSSGVLEKALFDCKAALEQLGALSDNRSRMHEARVDALRSVGAAQDDERRATRDEIAKRRQACDRDFDAGIAALYARYAGSGIDSSVDNAITATSSPADASSAPA